MTQSKTTRQIIDEQYKQGSNQHINNIFEYLERRWSPTEETRKEFYALIEKEKSIGVKMKMKMLVDEVL